MFMTFRNVAVTGLFAAVVVYRLLSFQAGIFAVDIANNLVKCGAAQSERLGNSANAFPPELSPPASKLVKECQSVRTVGTILRH